MGRKATLAAFPLLTDPLLHRFSLHQLSPITDSDLTPPARTGIQEVESARYHLRRQNFCAYGAEHKPRDPARQAQINPDNNIAQAPPTFCYRLNRRVMRQRGVVIRNIAHHRQMVAGGATHAAGAAAADVNPVAHFASGKQSSRRAVGSDADLLRARRCAFVNSR